MIAADAVVGSGASTLPDASGCRCLFMSDRMGAMADLSDSGATCTWCNKSNGPLAESPIAGVYICYECTRLLVHVFEEESKRRGRPLPEVSFDVPPELLEARKDNGSGKTI